MNRLLHLSRRTMLRAGVLAALAVAMPLAAQAKKLELRYGHMNSTNSVAGQQAQMFADLVEKYTNGEVTIRVYPSSQLGKMQEMAEATSTGA
jgi:TRAP-type C4-dicarboxylate transport system substrate-binding protein